MSYDIYTGLLKSFAMPAATGTPVLFTYDHYHPKLMQLKSEYPIVAIAGDGDDLSKAVNLLHWVSGHNYHKGDAGPIAQNSLDLLNYAYNKGSAYGINCVALATILSECLLAIGLKARKVFIMPCSPYDGDNHVVTHVFIRDMNKWVMLDPTLNAYLTNERGDLLSLLELRRHLAEQEPVFFNSEAKYNDDLWTADSAKENTEYFAKNLFYFQTSEISTFSVADVPGNRFITLCPQGYDPKQTQLSNIEYRIKKYGDNPHMQKWIQGAKQQAYHFCSLADFENAPSLT